MFVRECKAFSRHSLARIFALVCTHNALPGRGRGVGRYGERNNARPAASLCRCPAARPRPAGAASPGSPPAPANSFLPLYTRQLVHISLHESPLRCCSLIFLKEGRQLLQLLLFLLCYLKPQDTMPLGTPKVNGDPRTNMQTPKPKSQSRTQNHKP